MRGPCSPCHPPSAECSGLHKMWPRELQSRACNSKCTGFGCLNICVAHLLLLHALKTKTRQARTCCFCTRRKRKEGKHLLLQSCCCYISALYAQRAIRANTWAAETNKVHSALHTSAVAFLRCICRLHSCAAANTASEHTHLPGLPQTPPASCCKSARQDLSCSTTVQHFWGETAENLGAKHPHLPGLPPTPPASCCSCGTAL